ncbi:MAG: hypothetical protein J6V32_05215 [Elusimicrobiaceae bacterium]|nr:hypothetical protein [Elusimicrobiaceae bacterium]
MLKHFEKSPFVYDVMLNSTVTFNETSWTLSFAPEKAFYQIPAQSKLPELEKAALELGGRKVTIQLAAAIAPTATPAKTATQQSVEILDEEPLPVPQTVMLSSNQNAPEEVKEVLDMFPGELLA